MNFRHGNLGFTATELLFTLAVGAILISLAVPSFREYVADSRLTTTSNLLVSHLNAARSEAITRREPVAVCRSADESTCSDGTDWGVGWIVFTDSDGEAGERDGTDELLLAARPGRDVTLTAISPYVRFDELGMIDPQ